MEDKLKHLVSIIKKYWQKSTFDYVDLQCQVFFDCVNVTFDDEEVLSIEIENSGRYVVKIKPEKDIKKLYSYHDDEAEMAAALVVAETIRFAMKTEE